jgi:hypothetical protein
VRDILAVLAAAAVGALGAVILGEYPFKGVVILASGLVFGLFVAEAALAVSRHRSPSLGAVCASIGVLAMTWSAWITTGHDLSYLGPAGWAAVAATAVAAGLRAGGLRAWSSRRAAGTQAGTAPGAPSGESPPPD